MRNILAGLYWMLLLAAVRACGETVVWSDGFEGNAASRWQSTGVWHISSPTGGPAVNASGYRTHSGTNCASTQNYPFLQDVRLICTNYNGANSLLVPSASLSPRLRFWDWFNFDNALGFVEISTDYGANWTQISPTYGMNYSGAWINSSGVWSRPSIDLSAYAGQNVQIAFHFRSGCCYANGLGWYVDDVEVETGAPVLNFPEGFESDPKTSEWSVDFGTWEIGKPTSGPNAAHTGTNCAATVLAGDYANTADTRLISPPFVVPSSSPSLRFWQWYSFVNALGFVEVNNGVTNSTSTTNTTITTNTVATLNTNVYQLFGGLITDYATPLYWNPTIGGWTNATKALGSGSDENFRQYQYYFESGNSPLSLVGVGISVDYHITAILPIPQSTTPTNFPSMQGMVWNSPTDTSDNPVGYFGTNYTYTYTTNPTVTTSGSSWTQISPNYLDISSGTWTNTTLDLSEFAGQTVQIAFHFRSGDCCGIGLGWYVDDINLAAAPTLTVPTNQVISYGQTLTNMLSATNSLELNSVFTFALAAASTNVVVATNGVVTWTNTTAPPGTYPVYVQVTDNNTPPFSVTNSFSVTVLLLPSQLVLSHAMTFTNGGRSFKFGVDSVWANSAWVVLASTNLSGAPANWHPIYTNQGGSSGFTDQLSTNFLQRYYRAVFP